MRAREPEFAGFIERGGVRVGYEVFGEGEPAILLLPTWQIVHSRFWKGQVPFLARSHRVITYDARGSGRSDTPTTADAYKAAEIVADAVAVLDATSTESAIVVGLSSGSDWALMLAAEHPERVLGAVFVGGGWPGTPDNGRAVGDFDEILESDEGWAKENRHYWLRDWPGYVEFFMSQVFPEPHSSKQIEDNVGWALETTPQTMLAMEGADAPPSLEAYQAFAHAIRCPTLVIHGSDDRIVPHEGGVLLARALGTELVTFDGGGHSPLRDPVRFNLLLEAFIQGVAAPNRSAGARRTWPRAAARKRRALYVSSPIGLGHAQRDVAIAQALRRHIPDLEIDWLAQDPVTRVLEANGERIHPASRFLANESRHIESESAGHDLYVFEAVRRMDEILLANFMLFQEVVRDDPYDLWIGDESWEIDFFLHENPELKTTRFAFMTDFVGFLPFPDGGDREAFLTRDYNEEMLEQVARYPRIRDRAVFIGEPDDVVAGTFGDGLPEIREWTEANFDFAGYVLPFAPGTFEDKEGIRAELGYRPDEQVCLATVGGTAVGAGLLRRVVDAFPEAKRLRPELRMVAVCGPRIDPAGFPQLDGLEIRPYVHDLYRHLAVCDLAVVQGGLSTTMELVANQRPFLFVPLRHHFEQQFHVRHRLERYGATGALDYEETADPVALGARIAAELGRSVRYRPIEPGAADRAAARIAEVL